YTPAMDRKYTVADMLTGYGVAEAVKHYYKIYGGEIKNKRVIVQGFGNVGSAAAYYLTLLGAKVVGIIDRAGGLINKEGFTLVEMIELFLNKKGNALQSDELITFEEINQRIWSVPAEIFVPAAASRLVTKEQISKMIETGLEVISPGANVPFADKEIFFGPIMEYTDQQVSLIPDFISNCGIARVFAYLMEKKIALPMKDELIFKDTSRTIKKAIKNIHKVNATKKNISKTGFQIALSELI
ncbi:MAG: amino acid dehydrogenase, partial [Lutimonas sp.]